MVRMGLFLSQSIDTTPASRQTSLRRNATQAIRGTTTTLQLPVARWQHEQKALLTTPVAITTTTGLAPPRMVRAASVIRENCYVQARRSVVINKCLQQHADRGQVKDTTLPSCLADISVMLDY